MLRIVGDVQPQIVIHENPKAVESLRRRAERQKQASVVVSKATTGPLRLLPWPQFLAVLQHRRDIVTRAHVRWCMRAAIRHCETLRRSGGRTFQLRPGGRHNIISSGNGEWHETATGLERIHHGNLPKTVFANSVYMNQLEDNLRKLLCPPWAVPIVKRAIRAKLAVDWNLEFKLEGDEPEAS